MITIYLIRHSKPLDVNNDYTNDNLQLQNEKKFFQKKEKISLKKNLIHPFLVTLIVSILQIM